ncbi:hypothetical protein MMC29_007983, partial [Sticta canariensis]|nr:hypothetical protein [Sticta canariensis]
MSDPVSVAGTAVGLISLGIQVTQSLVEYYTLYKSQYSTLADMVERLECLSEIFQSLEKTLLDRQVQTEEQSLIKSIYVSIKHCDELIYELQDECQKFHKTSSDGFAAKIKVAGRRVTYPFRESTLQKLNENIGEIRDNLSSALDILQLKDNRKTQDDIAETKALLQLIRTLQISSNVRDWLKAPDATVDHNAACAKKHPGTGMWLVKSPTFLRWLTEPNSIIWLNGFAGSGKSVLCSTAIQFALRQRGSDRRIGIAFFYFTFNDDLKREEPDSTPPSLVLFEYLRRLIQRFHHVYIALDGLDESPRDGPREKVLDILNSMQNWSVQGLHLFLTSRDEPDIRDSLDLCTKQEVKMQNVGIDKDIANYISARLDTDRKLRKWLPHRDKIQDVLTKRAEGVFRWVDCQFRSLQFCPCSEAHLDCLLNSLPQSLDETYQRMLCNIDHELVEDARRILTLLCFAVRPLSVPELIDGVAVEINDPPGLNYKCRLQNFSDLHTICPGLIDINLRTSQATKTDHEDSTPTVQIAHFSVQEYLESKRIRHQKAAIFSLTSLTAHSEIAQICLVYLLEPGLSRSRLDRSVVEKYPLAKFSAKYWNQHYQNTVQPTTRLNEFVLRLFQNRDSFVNWIKLHDVDDPWFEPITFNRKSEDIAAPIYYASLLGLDHILIRLFKTVNADNLTTTASSIPSMTNISRLVNTQGRGQCDNALQTALSSGHEQVVQLLLDKEANVNAQGGWYGNALQAASSKGHEQIVQLLLKQGADVNSQGGLLGNALQAASSKGHEQIVQLLLNQGADVNAQGGYYGNALQAASSKGDEQIVQLLLNRGADVNAQGGYYGNALQAASSKGYEQIVQLLLNQGADVNAQGGYYGNALQAASAGGHEQIVQLLLDKRADVNAQGGEYGTALQAASLGGHKQVVQLLLDKKADVNTQGEYYGNALQAASSTGHEQIVQLLLNKGADVNAQGGDYGNALQAASSEGHEQVVQLLLNQGADVNAQGGEYGNALQAASAGGHEQIVQLLLDKRADVNAQGGKYGNALQAASAGGHEQIVQLLLDKRADVNAQGGKY